MTVALPDTVALDFFTVKGATLLTIGLDGVSSLGALLGLVGKSDIPAKLHATPN